MPQGQLRQRVALQNAPDDRVGHREEGGNRLGGYYAAGFRFQRPETSEKPGDILGVVHMHQRPAEIQEIPEFCLQRPDRRPVVNEKIQHSLGEIPDRGGDQRRVTGGDKQRAAVNTVPGDGAVPGTDGPGHIEGKPVLTGREPTSAPPGTSPRCPG